MRKYRKSLILFFFSVLELRTERSKVRILLTAPYVKRASWLITTSPLLFYQNVYQNNLQIHSFVSFILFFSPIGSLLGQLAHGVHDKLYWSWLQHIHESNIVRITWSKKGVFWCSQFKTCTVRSAPSNHQTIKPSNHQTIKPSKACNERPSCWTVKSAASPQCGLCQRR